MKVNRNTRRLWYWLTNKASKPFTLLTMGAALALFSFTLMVVAGAKPAWIPYGGLAILSLAALYSILSWIWRLLSGLILAIRSLKKDKPYDFKLVRSSRVRR